MLTPEAYATFIDGNDYGSDPLVINEREQLHNLCVKVLWDSTGELFTEMVSRKMFGSIDQCKDQRLDDIYNLLFYMDIIYDHMRLDEDNGELQDDEYYIDLYCLDCLANRLECENVPMDTIRRVYGLYGLSYGNIRYGIDYQGIEGNDDPVIID